MGHLVLLLLLLTRSGLVHLDWRAGPRSVRSPRHRLDPPAPTGHRHQRSYGSVILGVSGSRTQACGAKPDVPVRPTPATVPRDLINFFFPITEMRNRQSVKMVTSRHQAKPASSRSRSTSCTSGVTPSAPRARGRPSSESATARATTQDTMEPQRRRQVCSARRRRSGCSCRARALASWLIEVLGIPRPTAPYFHSEHHQPASRSWHHQLQISPLFAASCWLQSHSRCVGCTRSGPPVTVQSH